MTGEELRKIKSDCVVDGRRYPGPGAPARVAKKSLIGMKAGQVMEVLSDDAVTNKGLGAWAQKVGHRFLGALEGPGYQRLFIMRTK